MFPSVAAILFDVLRQAELSKRFELPRISSAPSWIFAHRPARARLGSVSAASAGVAQLVER